MWWSYCWVTHLQAWPLSGSADRRQEGLRRGHEPEVSRKTRERGLLEDRQSPSS